MQGLPGSSPGDLRERADWGEGAVGEKPEAAPTRGVEAEQRTRGSGVVRACTPAFSSKGSKGSTFHGPGLWFLATANTVLQARKLIQRLIPPKAHTAERGLGPQ